MYITYMLKKYEVVKNKAKQKTIVILSLEFLINQKTKILSFQLVLRYAILPILYKQRHHHSCFKTIMSQLKSNIQGGNFPGS